MFKFQNTVTNYVMALCHMSVGEANQNKAHSQ